MTNEEREDAINFFKEVTRREVGIYSKLAIEALEQQPCEDCISRLAVLNTLDKMDKALDTDRTVENYKKLLTECYKDLPPVTPKEKAEWIPVSERLPELNKDVLVCVVYKDYESEIYTGYLRKDIYDEGYKTWWSRSRGEVSFPIVHDVIAWMPLPKPYKIKVK